MAGRRGLIALLVFAKVGMIGCGDSSDDPPPAGDDVTDSGSSDDDTTDGTTADTGDDTGDATSDTTGDDTGDTGTDTDDTDGTDGTDTTEDTGETTGPVEPPETCDSDIDCAAAAMVCDPLTETCVQCLFESDCDDFEHCVDRACLPFTQCQNSLDCVDLTDQPICDKVLGECVQCLGEEDCEDSQHCVDQGCVDYTNCVSSKDCEDAVCDKALGECVDCLEDTDCADDQVCIQAVCETSLACDSDLDCLDLNMLCDKVAGTCAACLVNADCPSVYFCQGGQCLLDVCVTGQSACQDNAVVACNEQGSGFDAPAPCAVQQTCAVDGAVAACQDWACQPGPEYCQDNAVLACAEDGLSVVALTQCGEAALCLAGGCVDIICEPTAVFCAEDQSWMGTCSADGTSFETADCQQGTWCSEEAEAECVAWVCQPDKPVCDGNTATACNAAGSGFADPATECGEQVCEAGLCQDKVCEPDTIFCGDGQVLKCSAGGASSTLVVPCGASEYCDADATPAGAACAPQVCQPGAALCVENVASMCDDLGSGPLGDGQDCGDDLCVGGECKSVVCVPGSAYCVGDLALQCDATGTLPKMQKTCPPGECADGDCLNGLLAWWPLDEAAGDVANDMVGGFDGAVAEGTWGEGRVGGALHQNTVEAHVDAGDVLNDLALPITISAWVRLKAGGAGGGHVLSTDTASDHYAGAWLSVRETKIVISYGDGGAPGLSSIRAKASAGVPADVWMHLAAVIEGPTQMTIYIDGEDQGGVYSGSGDQMVHTEAPLWLGKWFKPSFIALQGALDDVRLYDTALSKTQIQAMIGGSCPAEATSACSDGQACTFGDTCVGGECAAGTLDRLPKTAWAQAGNAADSCNVNGALAPDGDSAGLDYTLGGFTTIGGVQVAGCVGLDFGASRPLKSVLLKAGRVSSACGGACVPDIEKGCGTDPKTEVFYGVAVEEFTHAATLFIEAGAPSIYPVAIEADARYVVVCRGNGGPGRDDITVDSVEAVYADCDVCVPNQPVCQENAVQVCDATGQQWLGDPVECTDQVCAGGACLDQICEPGSQFCDGDPMLCGDDGLSASVLAVCTEDQFCVVGDTGSAACVPVVCAKGASWCEGDVLKTCDDIGSAVVEETPCGEAAACVEDQCLPLVCTPKASECAGATSYTVCNATGTAWSAELVCPGGSDCTDNVCENNCAAQCEGKVCGADGCGGVCGVCSGTQDCTDAGECVDNCKPVCTGKKCGPNGCGGVCGGCSANQACEDGQCVDCIPDCDGETCGDDGCGGSCPSCAGGLMCTETGSCGGLCGTCSLHPQCSDIDFAEGNLSNWTVDGPAVVVPSLGGTEAPTGGAMLFMPTGFAGVQGTQATFQGCLEPGTYTIGIDWRFYSEEFKEWCGSQYQDGFQAKLYVGGGVVTLMEFTIDKLCPTADCNKCGAQYVGLVPSDVKFDKGGVYNTPWTHTDFEIDLTSPDGAPITFDLVLNVEDAGDSIYDSVMLIDRVTFTPQTL